MSAFVTAARPAPVLSVVPAWLTMLLAVSCGLIAANIDLAQPLIGPISATLGLSPGAGGLLATMAQLGYGAGLLFIVPLGDLVENRRLVLSMLCLAIVALAGAALSTHAAQFLAASLLIGLGSVAVQILVPYAAHLASDATRGRVVGNVMGGLLLGIMLERPTASLLTHAPSWHVVFALSAAVMAMLAGVLRYALPARHPVPGLGYARLLDSMGSLALRTPILQRRAFYQASLFAAFGLFWTAAPLFLADAFHLSQNGIALFALAGVAGAIAASIAGRAADRGWSRPATGLAMAAVARALLLCKLGPGRLHFGLAMLVVAAMLLDFGVTANGVLGQQAIFQLRSAGGSRLNGLYMATFFAGDAAGSALGSWAYAHGGWPWAMPARLTLPVSALIGFVTEQPDIPTHGDAA